MDEPVNEKASAYAKMHERFLAENFPKVLSQLKSSGQLPSYLHRLGSQAEEMYEAIWSQMLTSPKLPKDYAQRVEAMQAVPEQAEEMVLHDLVLCPPGGATSD
jgi:hypothetical protein